MSRVDHETKIIGDDKFYIFEPGTHYALILEKDELTIVEITKIENVFTFHIRKKLSEKPYTVHLNEILFEGTYQKMHDMKDYYRMLTHRLDEYKRKPQGN